MTGAEIRQMRKSLKLSQGRLAELIGVRQNTMSRYELGRIKIPEYVQERLRIFFGAYPEPHDVPGRKTMIAEKSPRCRSCYYYNISYKCCDFLVIEDELRGCCSGDYCTKWRERNEKGK